MRTEHTVSDEELRQHIKGGVLDHVAIAVTDIEAYFALFRYLGWETEDVYRPNPHDIGDGETSMHTRVVTTGGVAIAAKPAQIALMEGVNGKSLSQISYYTRNGETFNLQHLAYYFADVRPVKRAWEERGIRFLTPLLIGEEDGNEIIQAFTYPIDVGHTSRSKRLVGCKRFFEIKSVHTEPDAEILEMRRQFQDKNVRGLWENVRDQLDDIKCSNIFGEKCSLRTSLERRGIPVLPPSPTRLSEIV